MSNERKIKRLTLIDCSICYSMLLNNLVILKCGHIFHELCIYLWIKRKLECPICRIKIINYKRECIKMYFEPIEIAILLLENSNKIMENFSSETSNRIPVLFKKLSNSFVRSYKLNANSKNNFKDVSIIKVLFRMCQQMKKTIKELTKLYIFSYKYELMLQKEVSQNREKIQRLSNERCNIVCHLEETIKRLENLRLLKFDVEKNFIRVKMDFISEKKSRKRRKTTNIFKKILILSNVAPYKQKLKKKYKAFKKIKKTNFFFKIVFFLLKKPMTCNKKSKVVKNYKTVNDYVNRFINELEDGFKLHNQPKHMEDSLNFDTLTNNYPLNNY